MTLHTSVPPGAESPRSGTVPPTDGLAIDAMVRRTFPGPPAIARRADHHPHLQAYLSDLARPYGMSSEPREPEPHEMDGAPGHSYGEMSATVLDDLELASHPPDLLVLAFAVPDIRPGRATASYLSSICPGNPLAFAVCEQGAATPFTALRLLEAYAAGGFRRPLLVAVEQSWHPYPTAPARLPATHTAVALRCAAGDASDAGADAVARLAGLRQHPGVTPEQVPALLERELDAIVAGRPDTRFVADAGLRDACGGTVPLPSPSPRLPPPAMLHLGVWWELAAALDEPASGPVVVLSYEPQLRYLSIAVVEPASS